MKNEQTHRERTTDLGVVRINNDVIAAIASIAATEIRGVSRMGGGLKNTLYELLTSKTNIKGVTIKMADGDVRLIVSIVVEYGVDIPRIADDVQENVKRAVERMTGLVLSEVNVIVEGVSPRPRQQDKKI
jgi:uncharacterized alkaline shock family protein YloU